MSAAKSNSTPVNNVNVSTAAATYTGEQRDITWELKQPKQAEGVEKDRTHANDKAPRSSGRVDDGVGDGGENSEDVNGEMLMFLEDEETIIRGGIPMWIGRIKENR
ncbi:uncharacterized protein Z519_12313 [Cladophialophora bantiana CBS 173.52]|uniref:Uncharacterized protein n=1 Tax=Cladophialophora bantiana (strain ATCC 10958 / CBS 173.52 / CDC B-1940 / NIH 8579) TaxID=1442370 RepID=A0A0D2EAB9_CLAB1|nr:uncharacterized protein Z519_12313 [Cladophialophora bantiana CBS 173.52]KIW87016.1 hypothetical protein Z519_12313 [Cladophialophora bantiana CBS 173.52]